MSASPIKDPDALPQLVGDFQPVDIWQAHINRLFYGLRGSCVREYYQTVAVADYRLGFALAEDYWHQCQKRAKGQAGEHTTTPLSVMEWGAGNGNLAACFLDRLQELDHEQLIFPRVNYLCIEREPALLEQAKANPDLAKHRDRVTFDSASVDQLSAFPDGSVDRIICNELWSELPTKLILRKEGEIQEEQLRPNLNEKRLGDFPDWPKFVEAFDQKDIDTLKTMPPFLEDLVWEREYRPIETKTFPFRRTVAEFLKSIDEEVLVPYNVGACQSVKEAKRLLATDAIGFSSFDAGTVDHRVLNDPEKPCYTVQGGQFSFMVNFQLLEEVARHLGIRSGVIESQREYVGRSLGTNVLSVMDLLASHPSPPEGQAWELDALILRTLQALNRTYRCPYQRHIEFPLSESTPAHERAELEAIVQSLPSDGVPDTIAYLTEAEIWKAMPDLQKLGYDSEGIKAMLQLPLQPVDYTHMFFASAGL
ncbi:MAG: class I SAM-dependent methyltransferase [Nitrospirota bacterium]|nr:class I SAM-dependent methyltransferase [Nitrospirota bacterium]MDH4359355.1 class I SAM-dependent methyltransferase [Nitrospirota bacterium]